MKVRATFILYFDVECLQPSLVVAALDAARMKLREVPLVTDVKLIEVIDVSDDSE